MKKLLIAFSSAVVLVLVFMGGIYAANQDWLSFTGDEEITQADNNVDEIMKILRKTFGDKEIAESELAKIEAELEGIINDGPPGLVNQIKKLKEDIEGLKTELATATTNLATKKTKLSEANGTIESKNNQIAHLEKELKRANEKVESHAGKVSKALEDAKELVGENED